MSFDYGNGTTSQRSFNSGLQLKSIAHGTSSNPSAFLDLEYHYDEGIANTGRIMQMSDHNDPSRSVSYDYDFLAAIRRRPLESRKVARTTAVSRARMRA